MGDFRPLSAIRGRKVLDRGGEPVGRIHDVLLDLREGRIEYICIALFDANGGGAKEAIVPWSAMRITDPKAGESWVVAAGRAVLEGIAQPIAARD